MTTGDPVSPADAQRALRNVSAVTLSLIISRGLLFLWQLILARFLGEAGYGVYGGIGSFIAIGAAFTNFGTGAIIVREVARQPGRAGDYLGTSLILRSGMAMLAWLLLNIAAPLAGFGPEFRNLLALATISLLVDAWGNLCFEQLMAQERMRSTSLVTVLHMLLLLLAAALALASGYGLPGLYVATIAAGLARVAMFWGLVLRSGLRPARMRIDLLRSLLVESLPLAIAALLSLAWMHADKLMTIRLLGEAQNGWLTAAFVIVTGMIELLGTTVLTSLFPMMSRASGATLSSIVSRLAWFTLLAGLPLTLLLSLFAPEITVPLFGANYVPAAAVLRILVWYALLRLVADVYIQALITSNRQRRMLLVRAGGLSLNIALNALLLPRLGINGAALASLGSVLLVLVTLLHSTPVAAWRPLLKRCVPLVFLALALAAWMSVVAQLLSPLAAMVTGMLLYLPGLMRILDAGDRALLLSLARTSPLPRPLRKVLTGPAPTSGKDQDDAGDAVSSR
ncbi:MAG: oligosaccharide flippase family protein [Anaerolineaceae bacterium]|nr:oligosaccharide flippase family protein [Anaerolineaceae bacterium]